MTYLKSLPKLQIAAGALAVLVLTGWVIDLGVTSPRVDTLTDLSYQRGELETQLGDVVNGRFREVDAERALHVDDLEAYLAGDGEDPVAYIGRRLKEAGLARLDLATVSGRESAHIVTTKFDVRATGRYDELVAFVRDMESDSRLAEVHHFVIRSPLIGSDLEGRINLSLHDPKTRR